MIQIIIHSIMTFFDLTVLIAFMGAVWCRLWLVGGEYPDHFQARLSRLVAVCITALFINSGYGLVQRGMEMSGFGIGSVVPVLPTIVFKTHFGSMWLVRLAGLFTAGIAWVLARRRKGHRVPDYLFFLAAAVVAFSRSASGHPSDFGDLSLQQLSDWLHLSAASLWAGSILSLAAVSYPSLSAEDSSQHKMIAGIADRFYLSFGPLFSMMVLTGLFNAWVEVGSFIALFTTPYGLMLSAKLLLIIFTALRYVAPPEHGRSAVDAEKLFVQKFLKRTRFEACIVLGMMMCVAVLVHEIPAKHKVHLEQIRLAGKRVSRPQPVVSLETNPKIISAGAPVVLTVRIKEPDGAPFKGLAISHERILHAVIVGKDLKFFAHIHPEDAGPLTSDMVKKAAMPLLFTFPEVGKYLIGIDFSTKDEFYSRSFIIDVAAAQTMEGPEADFSRNRIFDGYEVGLTVSPEDAAAGEETILKYMIKKDGKAVTDLEPYLGASMHLAVVPADLKQFIHTHGSTPGEPRDHHDHLHAAPPPQRFGPEIDAEVTFPEKGIYKVFSQVQHGGRVLLFGFMVKAR